MHGKLGTYHLVEDEWRIKQFLDLSIRGHSGMRSEQPAKRTVTGKEPTVLPAERLTSGTTFWGAPQPISSSQSSIGGGDLSFIYGSVRVYLVVAALDH